MFKKPSYVFFLILISMLTISCGGGGGSSNPPPPDTDKDGHIDSQDAFPLDPLEWLDTDKDGKGNNSDAFPEDPLEWLDTDKDGEGDNSDTTPLGPVIPAWTTFQGNPSHDGFVNVTLNTENFKQRWHQPLSLSSTPQGSAGDGYIFFTDNSTLYALRALDGTILWSNKLTANNPPAYLDGIVYVVTGGHENAFLWAFKATDGSLVFKTPIGDQWSEFYAPTPVGNSIYMAGGHYGGMYKMDAKTGAQNWWRSLNQYDRFTPAVTDDYVIAYTGEYSPSLTVADKATGDDLFTIPDLNFEWNGWSMNLAPVVSGSYVLAIHNYRLICFDLNNRLVAWQSKSQFTGQPIINGNRVYAINNGIIEIRNIADGSIINTINGAPAFASNMLTSNNLLFVSDGSNTHAYDLQSNHKVWSLNGKAGSMYIAEGALLILTSAGVTAIDIDSNLDKDSLPDWWEKRFNKNLNETADIDQDGLNSLAEYNAGTNPVNADSDNDSLSDGLEVNTHSTDPLNADTDNDELSDHNEIINIGSNPLKSDSDEDGLTDVIEIEFALNPNNASDAEEDTDNDGFINRDEINAGTNFMDDSQYPQVSDWGMLQANASHNGFQPIKLNKSNFSIRWDKNIGVTIKGIATGGNQVFATIYSSNNELHSFNVTNGIKKWGKTIVSDSISAPSFKNNLVYLHTGGHEDTALWAFNPTSGTQALRSAHGAQWPSYLAPTLFDTNAYMNGGYFGGVLAKNAITGIDIWSTGEATWDEQWEPAVDDQNIYHPNGMTVVARDRLTGQESFTLDSGAVSKSPVLGTKGNLLVTGTYIQSFDLTSKSLKWRSQESDISGIPSVGNNSVYFISNGRLFAVDESTGRPHWNWKPDNNLVSNLVVTLSHVFVATDNVTYAISVTTGQLEWSYNFGGVLALGKDEALYVFNNSQLVSINLTGDSDSDDIPDWWEKLFGLNPANNDDADADNDSDGLNNLQEFVNQTDPTVADADGDQLNDYQEVITHQTDPNHADSDNDGLPDGWEVSHSFDPLNTSTRLDDTDGDGVNNYFEFTENTDPLNALSHPELFGFISFSFEDSQLPSGWSISNDSTHVAITSEAASDGDYSLSAEGSAKISFSGFFAASDFTFDLKKNCLDSNLFGAVTVSIDGKPIITSDALADWASIKTIIPFGRHTVTFETSSYSCKILLDNVAITAAKSNVQAGIQLISLDQNILRFVDANGNVAKSMNVSFQESVGTAYAVENLDNNKLAVTMYSSKAYLGILDLNTFQWNYIDLSDEFTYYLIQIASIGENIYLSSHHNASNLTGIVRLNFSTGEKIRFGSQNYNAIGVDKQGNIYGHTYGLLHQYNPATLQITSTKNAVSASRITIDSNNNIVLGDEINHLIRYTPQHLVNLDLAINASIYEIGFNSDDELIVAMGNELRRYTTDFNSYSTITVPATEFAVIFQPDTDNDTMPDWWEIAYGLNHESNLDATTDTDNDQVTAKVEFEYRTDPNNVDSDSDLLTDGDEINDLGTNPTSADSDSDDIDDAAEVLTYLTNPLLKDTDGDSFTDGMEIHLFLTDPNDTGSAPQPLSNFAESFEGSIVGWSKPVTATAGWSVSSVIASVGTKSLQSDDIQDSENAEIEWSNLFTDSTLAFDVIVSSESCCDLLNIYIDNELKATQHNNESWQRLEIPLPEGYHTIRFQYKKDSSVSSGSDSVWIDNITIQ